MIRRTANTGARSVKLNSRSSARYAPCESASRYPAAVRVEAGWDRTAPAWAFINRFPITDIPLAGEHADTAAGIVKRTGASVAGAHLGAAIQAAQNEQVLVITSDPGDMQRVAEGRQVNVVAL